jgi:hypothetical protein
VKGWRIACLLLVASARPLWPDQIEDAARDLARKIATVPGYNRPGTLSVRNQSSLSADDASRIRHVLETELGRSPRAGSDVRVTLSENFRGLLWVGEVRRGEDRAVVFLAPPRPATRTAGKVTLTSTLIQTLAEPILDVAFTRDRAYIVLTPSRIIIFRDRVPRESMVITPATPLPRDPRGRLQLGEDSFQAYLPGIACSGSMQPSPAMECRTGDAPWPLDGVRAAMASGRNFFAAEGAPFYSVADTGRYRLFAGLDRQVRVRDSAGNLVKTVPEWGSDIAAIDTACGKALALATGPGDDDAADFVQAYEIIEAQPQPRGDPLRFPGRVTALWRSGASVVAVVHNPTNDQYAAYDLAIACSP